METSNPLDSSEVLRLSKSTIRRHSAIGEDSSERSPGYFLGSESFTCSTFDCGREVTGWCQCCGDTPWCDAAN